MSGRLTNKPFAWMNNPNVNMLTQGATPQYGPLWPVPGQNMGVQQAGDVVQFPPKYSRDQLMGTGLQRLIEGADNDSDLADIAHALRFHGLMVPPGLEP